MMNPTFDVVSFFNAHNVDYVTQGANVKKGNINVACPFCGDDPSHHLGIDPKTGFWGCWRNSSHRGRKLPRLLAALTGISLREAYRACEEGSVLVETSVLSEIANGNFFEGTSGNNLSKPKTLSLLPEFKPYGEAYSIDRFNHYLRSRGFSYASHRRVFKRYDLHYCYAGFWKNRLILPVYLESELVTWTSRAIDKREELRYMSLANEDSVVEIKNTVYNYDRAFRVSKKNKKGKGKTLFVVEGPFDAIKLDFYATPGVSAIALYSLNVTEQQTYLVSELARRYARVVVLLDAAAFSSGLTVLSSLPVKNKVNGILPENVEDPGKLTKAQVKALCASFE